MNATLRRVLLAFIVIASLLLSINSPASATTEEEERISTPSVSLIGPESCAGDIVLDFSTRFLQGYSAETETVAANIPAGVYDLTINTYDGYEDRATTSRTGQTAEKVEVLGVTSLDLDDGVTEAWGSFTQRVTITEALTSVTATHATEGASGPNSVILDTVCLTEVVEVTAPTITFECVDADSVRYTVSAPNDLVALDVWVDGQATTDLTGIVATGTEVQAQARNGEAVSAMVDERAPECDDDNKPVEAAVSFECVGEDAVAYSVTSDAFGLSVTINGADANLSGTVPAGATIVVTTYTGSRYSDELIVLVEEFTAPNCEPENEPVEATIAFECASPNSVVYTVTADAFGAAVSINGADSPFTGTVAVGDVIKVSTYTEAMYSDELITWVGEFTAPECEAEVTPEATISTVCNADLTARDYTVTAADGSYITGVYVNGTAAALTGTVYPGDVISVDIETDGIYADRVMDRITYTATDCELPYTGSTTTVLVILGLVLTAGGGALVFAKRKFA